MAERTLSADPGQVAFWQEVLSRPDVEDYVPGGTLEAIERERMDAETATLRIPYLFSNGTKPGRRSLAAMMDVLATR